jgi:hypothetical protein
MADRRGVRALTAVAVLAAIWLPVAVDRDGFPFSTYPMYSSSRGEQVTFATANGVTADGGRQRLSLGLIGNSDDPLIVAGELRAALRDGRADARCREIAKRVASALPGVQRIEVVTERHDVVAQVEDRDGLVERRIHAECPVESAS